MNNVHPIFQQVLKPITRELYKYHDTELLQQRAEALAAGNMPADFNRYGITVYVGGDPDIIAPDFVIDPKDNAGVEIFKRFCAEMGAHYKTLNR